MPEIYENTYGELSDIEDGAFDRGEESGYKRGLLEAARMAEEEAKAWRSKAGASRHAIAASLDKQAARLRAAADASK